MALLMPAGLSGLTVDGRVVDASGAGIEGVRLVVRPLETEHARCLRLLDGRPAARAVSTGSSDADGRFGLEVDAPGLYELEARARGFAPMSFLMTPLLHDVQLPQVTLLESRAMVLSVDDSELEGPAEGVLLRIGGARGGPWQGQRTTGSAWRPAQRWTTTDENGRGRLPVVEGEESTLELRYPGRFARRYPFGSSAARRYELLRSDLPTLETRIKDAENRPIADLIILDRGRVLAKTDREGRVILPADVMTREGEPRTLHFVANNGSRWQFPVTDSGETFLPPARFLDGRVLAVGDRKGQPEGIAGAMIWDRSRRWIAESDRDGSFRWPLGASEGLALAAARQGYEPTTFFSRSTPEDPVRLVLQPSLVITGRVSGPSGGGLGNVTVDLLRVYDGQIWPGAEPEKNIRTDPEGRFRIHGVEAGASYAVRALAEGYPPSTVPAAAGDEVELVLRRGAEVSGVLVDSEGEALAGGLVEVVQEGQSTELRSMIDARGLAAPAARSADDGAFVVDLVPAGRLAVRASAENYVDRFVAGIEVEPGDAHDLGEIRLARAQTFVVRVRDEDGRPIEGARVHVWDRGGIVHDAGYQVVHLFPEASSAPGKTDAGGGFVVEGHGRGSQVEIQVDHEDYVAESRPISVAEAEVEFVLGRGAIIAGRVVDASGAPVAGASVDAMVEVTYDNGYSSGTSTETGHAFSDEQGTFELTGLPAGVVRLSAREPGKASFFGGPSKDVFRIGEREIRRDVVLVTDSGTSLEGWVVDSEGQPVGGAQVTIEISSGPNMSSSMGVEVDAEGFFEIGNLPSEGTVVVRARHRSHGDAEQEVSLVGSLSPITLRLGGRPHIAGRVVDLEGRPIARVDIRVLSRGAEEEGARTEVDGGFWLPVDPDTDYVLRAWNEESIPTEHPVSVGRLPVRDIELVLRPGSRIVGAITGVESARWQAVSVQASLRTSEPNEASYRRGGVDHRGSYRISGLVPGTWTVVAEMAGSARRIDRKVEVPEGATEVRADLDFGGDGLVLEGRVRHNGEPASGAMVHPGNLFTDTEGRFRIEGLDAGAYELILMGPWGSVQRRGELFADDFLDVEITTHRAGGVVLSGAGEPVVGAEISAMSIDGTGGSGHARTDSSGRFVMAALPPGSYRVMTTVEGGGSARADVDVRTERDDIVLRLGRSGALLIELSSWQDRIPAGFHGIFLDATNRVVHAGMPTVDPAQPSAHRFDNVPEGDWALVLVGQGAAISRTPVTVPGGPYPIRLEPGTSLRVALSGNDSVAGEVEIRDSRGELFSPSLFGSPVQLWPLRDGVLEMPYLPAGIWTVRVTTSDGRVFEGSATTSPDLPAELVFD